MISRFDKIAVDLPRPKNPSPNDAAAVQELLGGKFGEMSTLMNYTYQSFNFRGRKKLRPFYDLIASIAAEEYSHIETLSYAINLLLTGTTKRGKDPSAHRSPTRLTCATHTTLSPAVRRLCRWIRWASRGRATTYFRAAI